MGVTLGKLAPDFTLPGDRGSITLSAYRGKTNVLLAFYPGDFTPVCTSEMQCFAQDWKEFRGLGCEILGISADPIDKHREFARQLRLEFPLLSDRDRRVSRLYGVDSVLGTRRAYFAVDREGVLRYQHVEFLPLFKRDDAELLSVLRGLK
ncbi:MAG: peroxiredoxin family protein [Cyanobacteria bacterium J06642_2]